MPTLIIDGAALDIVVRQGKTFNPTLAWKLPGGELMDLTGYSALWVARRSPSEPPLFSIASGAGITLGGTPHNIVGLISAAITAAWPAGKYLHELELTASSGTRGFLQGRLTVLAETARP